MPGARLSGRAGRIVSNSTIEVSMMKLPPFGMASRAFMARLTMTCSNCPGSTRSCRTPGPAMIMTLMFSPSRRFSMVSMLESGSVQVDQAGLSAIAGG